MGVTWSAQQVPTAVNISFLDSRSHESVSKCDEITNLKKGEKSNPEIPLRGSSKYGAWECDSDLTEKRQLIVTM
jgi:hypothetical protein